MPECKKCREKIDGEWYRKHFKRCTACYQKFKKKQFRICMISAIMYFSLSIIPYVGPLISREWLFYGVFISTCLCIVGANMIIIGLRWKYTEVLHWRSDRGELFYKITTIFFTIAFALLFLIFNAFFIEGWIC
ncbi:MAG: hypothetical protein ACFFCS_23145 [Candidatus Hodarchaeota archaeon]